MFTSSKDQKSTPYNLGLRKTFTKGGTMGFWWVLSRWMHGLHASNGTKPTKSEMFSIITVQSPTNRLVKSLKLSHSFRRTTGFLWSERTYFNQNARPT